MYSPNKNTQSPPQSLASYQSDLTSFLQAENDVSHSVPTHQSLKRQNSINNLSANNLSHLKQKHLINPESSRSIPSYAHQNQIRSKINLEKYYNEMASIEEKQAMKHVNNSSKEYKVISPIKELKINIKGVSNDYQSQSKKLSLLILNQKEKEKVRIKNKQLQREKIYVNNISPIKSNTISHEEIVKLQKIVSTIKRQQKCKTQFEKIPPKCNPIQEERLRSFRIKTEDIYQAEIRQFSTAISKSIRNKLSILQLPHKKEPQNLVHQSYRSKVQKNIFKLKSLKVQKIALQKITHQNDVLPNSRESRSKNKKVSFLKKYSLRHKVMKDDEESDKQKEHPIRCSLIQVREISSPRKHNEQEKPIMGWTLNELIY